MIHNPPQTHILPLNSFRRTMRKVRSFLPILLSRRANLLTSLALISFSFAVAGTASAERLTIIGPEGEREFSQGEIMDIPEDDAGMLVTSTPWTDGPQTFRGAPLAAVLAKAGIEDGRISARALNDYAVTLPVDQVLEAGAFLAVQINGEMMRIRDNGPFWIVFPWDARPELDSQEVHDWAVWQLRSLSAVD